MMDVVFAATLIIGFSLLICFVNWCDKQISK